MRIDLAPEVEHALEEAARKRGTTPESLVVGMILEHIIPHAPPATPGPAGAPANLAEALAGHSGGLDSGEYVPGGAQLSENSSARFADLLFEKRRNGRL